MTQRSFADLLESQWSDYAERHRNKTNLMIHIIAVPVLWLGAVQVLGALFLVLLGVPGAFERLLLGAILVGGSLFAQARGNALEKLPPPPFTNAQDFARRAAAEQFVTFPRFVLTGGWLANLKAAG